MSKPYQTPQEAQLTYDLQHGFRQKSSCEAQLIQLAEDLGRPLEQGKQTDQVLLDFSRTFDKITYCKFGNFRENFIFANSIKRHI